MRGRVWAEPERGAYQGLVCRKQEEAPGWPGRGRSLQGVTVRKKAEPSGLTTYSNLCFSPRGRSLHPRDAWAWVPRRVWGSESHQRPGLAQLVTLPLAVPTQISRRQLEL